MQCARCHAENPAGMKFCGQCAAPLASVCPSCGAANLPGNKFCGQCATPLTKATESRFESPESYTPKHLAEKILTSRSALEGERKQVTVLFADLKGSLELLADRDPEEARKILDPVVERMMEAIHRYEGTVNQVMGDGIMALFGAPLAHEDHAVRACYAALRMQESVAQCAETVFRSHGVPILVRVGLNSGEVVVRAIGSDLHMDYTAVGQTTHLAARMEQMATPGTILLAPATLQLAEGYVQVAARGPVAVKGLPDPVEVYALTGASAQRTRLHAAAVRGLTRFVGRDAEIEQMRQTLALAQQGHGQLVALVGEPGVGKSRLVYEFTHSHRTQDWLILEAGSVSYGKATSYLPVIDLLKAYFKVNERETHREIREKVTGKLLTLDRTLEPTLPALLALLDVPGKDAQWEALDPVQRRQRTLDAVKHLLLRESQGQPVLVVVEDLHWIDAETQALLDGLVESLPTARVLLLVNYRPEYRHDWVSKTYYSQLRLDALPPATAGEFLGALLGADPALEPLKRLLVRRGNPLFIEESIRTLVETGALTGERGAYHLTRAIQAIEVPATVQVILAARIDRLPAEDKQLLQTASVIGKDVPFVLLQAVAEAAEDAVHRGLTHLQAAEFLYETRLFPDPEYTFKHALTHEVTYGTLLQERRKILHARIVGAIESFYSDRLDEHVERLAHHAFRGEVWDKTLLYSRQAGAKAFLRSANQEAVAWFEQALLALKHLPENRDTIEQAVDLRFELRNALWLLGELAQILERLREAESLATAIGDQRRLGRIFGYKTNSFAWAGDYRRALESGQRARTIADGLGDFALQVATDLYLGLVHCSLGDYRRAMDLLGRAVASLEGDLLRERFGLPGLPSVLCRSWLVWCLAQIGEFTNGTTKGKEAVRIAEAVDQPYTLVYAYIGLGDLYLHKGDFHQAARLLEQGLELCRLGNIRRLFVFVASRLGAAYGRSGRVADALPLLEQAVEHAVAMGMMGHQSISLAWLSEGYLLAGRVDDALSLAERALHLSRSHKEQGNEAWTLRFLGEIATHHDPEAPTKAEDYYRQAMGLAEKLEMRPLAGHCHFGLGRLFCGTDDHGKAQEHLATAARMYREMDMGFWLEKAEAALMEPGPRAWR
jgi:class 3 adenylate cyclase/tetratricopeptide (TPR) repeat protein